MIEKCLCHLEIFYGHTDDIQLDLIKIINSIYLSLYSHLLASESVMSE